MPKPYVLKLIEFLENHTNGGATFTGTLCRQIAEKLRAEMPTLPPPQPPTYCDSPKTHAPDCDCRTVKYASAHDEEDT